jgi:CRP-like cAMP-binding protein
MEGGIILVMAARKRSPLEIKTTEVNQCTISERLKILGKVPFFQDLSSTELEWVNSLFHQQDYNVDDVIYLSAEPASKFFVVAEGRIKLIRHSMTGRDILLDLLTSGEYFGAHFVQGKDVYPDTAQAQTDCCILAISMETFQQILKRFPSVSLKMLEIMAKRLLLANERVHQLSAMTIEGRIASLLVMLCDKFGEQAEVGLLLQVPLSRENLAGMAGTTTETASRVMSQFQRDGLIQSGREWVAVTDLEGLKAITGNELE